MPAVVRRVVVAAAVVAVMAVAAACGGSTQDAAAVAAASSFAAAVTAGNGAAACALLTDRARSGVESFGRSCAQVIVGLPQGGPVVGRPQVWGESAQVRFEHDVVFLAAFGEVWKVRAAGCRPVVEQPYDCTVRG